MQGYRAWSKGFDAMMPPNCYRGLLSADLAVATRTMTKIDAKTVKQLRDMTGAPMMDCKSALAEAGGNIEDARNVLRKRGQQVASKAAGREVSEGVIYGYSHHNRKVGVMVEIVCETDFVAMNEDFKAFCHGVALSVTAFNPAYLNKEAVPAEAVEKEKAIVTEMTVESTRGQPEQESGKADGGRRAPGRCVSNLRNTQSRHL